MENKNQEKILVELDEVLRVWNSTQIGRRGFLAAAASLLAVSCASSEKTRYREGDNSGQNIGMTPEDERKLTAEALPEMRKDYPSLNNSEVQNYISSLGQKLVRANNLDGNPYKYTFSVVDTNMVNAFALPAGTVFVTAPLLAMAETEAELAGVVGHEIGHIRARHTAERMEKAKRDQTKTALWAVGGAVLGGLAGYGIGNATCAKGDNDCRSRAAQLGAMAGAGGGLLIQKYQFMANSREDEMEADRIGFRTAFNAGFDKDAVGTFYAKLLKMEEQHKGGNPQILQGFQDAMSTHPPSKERVAQMNQMAAEARNSPNAIVSSNSFTRVKDIVQKLPKKTS